jgi:rubrerythrin
MTFWGGDGMGCEKLVEAVEVAIKQEEEAFAFYMDLAGIVEDKEAKDTLRFLALEEKKHKEFLEKFRQGGCYVGGLAMSEPLDYKVVQHLEAPDPKKDMKTKDVYLVAAFREQHSHDFYKGLADLHPAGEVKDLLIKMAKEELKHKEKVEYLYVNTAFPQLAGG